VQGVGFRPFIFRVAKQLNINSHSPQPFVNTGIALGQLMIAAKRNLHQT